MSSSPATRRTNGCWRCSTRPSTWICGRRSGCCRRRRPPRWTCPGVTRLSRALDVAAGEAVQLSGAEPLLVDRIDAEYLRYFTPTGRPTGDWAAATNRLRAADDEVARCAAAVARGRRRGAHAWRAHARISHVLTDERADASKASCRSAGGGGGRRCAHPAAQRGRRGGCRRRCHACRVAGGAHRTPAVARRHRRADRGDRAVGSRRRRGARGPGDRRRGAGGGRGRRRGRAGGGRRPVRRASTRPAAPSNSWPTATRRTGWRPGSPRSTWPGARSSASIAGSQASR